MEAGFTARLTARSLPGLHYHGRKKLSNRSGKMFYIHPQERPLIDAAIRLGEWIAVRNELSAADREHVSRVLVALKRLPAVTPDISGSFGFEYGDDCVESWDGTGNVPSGTSEHWEVCYLPIADSPGNHSSGQVWLEVFNNRWTYPQCYYDDLYDMQFELDFLRTSVDSLGNKYDSYTPDPFTLARIYDWVNCADHIESIERRKNFRINAASA